MHLQTGHRIKPFAAVFDLRSGFCFLPNLSRRSAGLLAKRGRELMKLACFRNPDALLYMASPFRQPMTEVRHGVRRRASTELLGLVRIGNQLVNSCAKLLLTMRITRSLHAAFVLQICLLALAEATASALEPTAMIPRQIRCELNNGFLVSHSWLPPIVSSETGTPLAHGSLQLGKLLAKRNTGVQMPLPLRTPTTVPMEHDVNYRAKEGGPHCEQWIILWIYIQSTLGLAIELLFRLLIFPR